MTSWHNWTGDESCAPAGFVRPESMDALAACPACGSGDVSVSGGDELVLESVWFGGEGTAADVPGHSR